MDNMIKNIEGINVISNEDPSFIIKLPYEEVKNYIGTKRKKNKISAVGKHNKFSKDNLRIKAKNFVLKYFLDFVNNKLIEIYENDLGFGLYKKEFQSLTNFNSSNDKMKDTIFFINKTMREIFTQKISTKFSNYLPQHNKLLYERLIKDEDEKKKQYFKKLFDLTFIMCWKHFIGIIEVPELKGMKTFKEIQNTIIEEYEDGKIYAESLSNYMKVFETLVNEKKQKYINNVNIDNVNINKKENKNIIGKNTKEKNG
jgi:hypothetical protein